MKLTIGLTLSDRFKLLRREENYTQRDLSKALGIPQTTISSIESGNVKTINTTTFNKFVEHPTLSRYALWLLNDRIDPQCIESMLDFLKTD